MLRAGLNALTEGRWQDAVDALSRATVAIPRTQADHAVAAAASSEALWWLGRVEEALAARADAYAVWRGLGDDDAASMTASWLAREYALALGNEAAARGWLARAERIAAGTSSSTAAGWVALTRALLADGPAEQAAAADVALAHAGDDPELEVQALARRGLARIAGGQVDDGLRDLDEAMAAATGGETGLSALAALCCDLVSGCELSGELERFAQWNEIVGSLAVRHGHPGLISFCATCCAEAFTAGGDWAEAERQLRRALEQLISSGHRARCIAPASKLGQLLVDQGRFEEARAVVSDDDDGPSLLVRARLALEAGDPQTATVLLERRCRRLGGDSLLTAPALAVLVEAHLAAGEIGRAADAAARLEDVAAMTGNRRQAGRAALAHARVAVARGEVDEARRFLERALDELGAVAPGAVETAEAHLELARLLWSDASELAVAEARAALAGFEAAGAAHAADAAAALLRSLGDRTRVGPEQDGVLTRREQEVLRLVSQGLTNAEIAGRLFISTKTAGNHVSNILAKLGLRSRVEAAAHAALHSRGWTDQAP